MDWPPGSHASTFGGNPVSCRAALATLDLLDREYLANCRERGAELAAGLKRLAEGSARLARPRGLGLMQAVDLVDNLGQPDPSGRGRVIRAAFERGLLLLGCGKTGVRFCPPLCIDAAEVQTGLELFAQAVSAAG
jgi:4-aminobutyrate aminotransferase